MFNFNEALRIIFGKKSSTEPGSMTIKDIVGKFNIFAQGRNISQKIIIRESLNCFQSMSDFLKQYNKSTTYISFPDYEEVKSQILKRDQKIIRLLGLSGLGKSRLIYEIFSNVEQDIINKTFYCSDSSDSRMPNDLSSILAKHSDVDGYIVLDNCNTVAFTTIINTIISSNAKYKIVAIYNDPNEPANSYGVNVIHLTRETFKPSVDNFIDNSLKEMGCDDSSIHEQIRKMADGFPQIAIQAIEEYRKQGSPKLIQDDRLWAKMCGNSIQDNDNKKAFQSLALLDPLGYKDEVKGDFEFVKHTKSITPLFSGQEKIDYIFSTLIKTLINRELLDKTSSWINVRPLPLAVWLIGQWFADCDEQRFEKLLQDIDSIPDEGQSRRIKRAFCKRLENMQDNANAIQMFKLLMGGVGPFRSEKVVCSDFGSRLFLSISTVNHVAVSECLYNILEGKSTNWLKSNISGDIRRNLVWCYEHLCFPQDTFEQSAWILAKLSLAENEKWGNNATGQFLQLFHVALPGTEATLNQRSILLKRMLDAGEEFIPLLIRSIGQAFQFGYFTRDGYGEKFGLKKLKDYNPTNLEILCYWKECVKLVQSILSKYPSFNKNIRTMVLDCSYELTVRAGTWDLFLYLVEIAYETGDKNWVELRERLFKLQTDFKGSMSETIYSQLGKWIDKVSPKDFKTILSDARYKLFQDSRQNKTMDSLEFEKQYWKTFAQKFVDEKQYDDKNTISDLIDYKDIDYAFVNVLVGKSSVEQLSSIEKNIEECFKAKDKKFQSYFVNIFIYTIHEESIKGRFYDFLLKNGFFIQYTVLKAVNETEDLAVLDGIIHVIREYNQSFDELITVYLQLAPLHNALQMYNTCMKIKKNFKDCYNILLRYVLRRYFDNMVLEEPMKQVTLELALSYSPDKHPVDLKSQVEHLVENILEKSNNSDFAKAYNKKIIESANVPKQNIFVDVNPNIYFQLLPKYQDAVLEDILDTLTEENSILFYIKYKDHLGSGSGFGKGPLFQCNIDIIKEKCLSACETELPQRLACMCPVFEYSEEKKGFEDRFSNFIYWMIDNFNYFKNQKEILDSFHSNMGSYFWTGSELPLLQKKVKAFTALKSYTDNQLLNNWIAESLSALSNRIDRVTKQEAYEGLVNE